jgi:methylated-DNA-[protein]-cysteine S-methyltransferase
MILSGNNMDARYYIWKMSTSDFAIRVYFYATQIPRGKVTTYKLLATAAGNEKASRSVGRALSVNAYAPWVPCHRVIASDGTIGGFFGSTEAEKVGEKIGLLRSEGVVLSAPGASKLTKAEMRAYVFSDFEPMMEPITQAYLETTIGAIRVTAEKQLIEIPETSRNASRGLYYALDADMKCSYILNEAKQVIGKLPRGHSISMASLDEADVTRLQEYWQLEAKPEPVGPRIIQLPSTFACTWCKSMLTRIALRHGTGPKIRIVIRPICDKCMSGYKAGILKQYYQEASLVDSGNPGVSETV